MSVTTADLKDGAPVKGRKPSTRKALAAVAQAASYMTTLWAVQWVWDDGSLAAQIVAALVVEAVLVGMKSALFDKGSGNDGIGWAGFVIDALTNLGGILPRAGKVLTWPPIATLLGLLGLSAADTTVQSVGGLIIAGAAAILLSVLPHRLWRG